jgi:PAS domain S-box-containing protein
MSEREHTTIDPRLVESEQRYRAVIENASDMIQSVLPDGTFEFVNDSWLRVLGYTADEVKQLIIWDIIYPDAVDHCQGLFMQALGGQPIPHMTSTFMTKAGDPVPVEGNVTLRMVGDTIVATHGFFRDISERLRAQELEERNIRLEREQQARFLEKMAALGKLSAGLAHELNNPAAAVQRANSGLAGSMIRRDARMRELIGSELHPDQWQAIDVVLERIQTSDASGSRLSPLEASEHESIIEEWLEDHGVQRAWDSAPGLVHVGITPDDLEQLAARVPADALMAVIGWLNETITIRESIEIISRSSYRISELVQAVKGYSHMDRATEQYVDVHDGLENTLIILGHRLRNITVHRDYGKDLPPIRVFGNTLNQVWTNILDNAVDATDGKGSVIIRTRRVDDQVVVEIEDNGAGISEADLACIFEPFYTTKPQGQGTGLGLDTAWRIVTEEHGGTISAESVPGRTVFRVAVPIAEQSS